MINPRLFKHYDIDTRKDLAIPTVCARPFDTVLVDRQGSCYACECQSWLPQSIGNLQVKPLAEIIGSDMHQHLRDSVSDGTYRYCNDRHCGYIMSKRIHPAKGTQVRHLRLAIDDSCNLRCPSCRTNMIFHKEGSAYRLGIRLADRINDWLHDHDHPIQVHMGSDGDPFASHVYRHFMAETPRRDNIKYSILTNGLMFKEFHGTVPHIIGNLQELGVSIDGATRNTYEKLRLGGRWEKILEALECMAALKQSNGFAFHLHMVVQKDNWREIPAMLELGDRYRADKVYFNRIKDWGTGADCDTGFLDTDEFRKLYHEANAHDLARFYSLF